MDSRWLETLVMSASVHVILNPLAGTHARAPEDLPQQLDALFKAQGISPRIALARRGAEVRKLAWSAVRELSQLVIAGGGDGTVNTVAAALVGTEVVLGVLPLGTLNHFAKDLGLPLELGGAVQTIGAGHTVRIDVGEVNGQMFLNNSSLGLYPRIVRHRQKQTERLGRGKWPAFLWATLVFLSR